MIWNRALIVHPQSLKPLSHKFTNMQTYCFYRSESYFELAQSMIYCVQRLAATRNYVPSLILAVRIKQITIHLYHVV